MYMHRSGISLFSQNSVFSSNSTTSLFPIPLPTCAGRKSSPTAFLLSSTSSYLCTDTCEGLLSNDCRTASFVACIRLSAIAYCLHFTARLLLAFRYTFTSLRPVCDTSPFHEITPSYHSRHLICSSIWRRLPAHVVQLATPLAPPV